MNISNFVMNNFFMIEVLYSILLVLLCMSIYLKTKEISFLTADRGVSYFRTAFLLFSLFFISRGFMNIVGINIAGIDLAWKTIPIIIAITGYLGMIAILYLLCSFIWKKINFITHTKRIIAIHLITTIVVLIDFLFSTITAFFIAQTLVYLLLLIISYKNYKNSKNKQSFLKSYFIAMSTLFIIWVINVIGQFTIESTPYVRLIVYVGTIIGFGIVSYGVIKATK